MGAGLTDSDLTIIRAAQVSNTRAFGGGSVPFGPVLRVPLLEAMKSGTATEGPVRDLVLPQSALAALHECSINPDRVGCLVKVLERPVNPRKFKKPTHRKGKNRGQWERVERWVVSTVRFRANRRARRPGATLVDVIALTGAGGSNSLAYVRGHYPRYFLFDAIA